MSNNTIELTYKPNVIDICVEPPKQVIITPLNPNQRGEKGADGQGVVEELVCGQPIVKFRVLTTNASGKAIYASNMEINHVNRVIGISMLAGAENATIKFQRFGLIYNDSWNWTPTEVLYLGEDGVITNSPPVLGSLIVCGYAQTNKQINFTLDQNIMTWTNSAW
jgi:hypothetical protein